MVYKYYDIIEQVEEEDSRGVIIGENPVPVGRARGVLLKTNGSVFLDSIGYVKNYTFTFGSFKQYRDILIPGNQIDGHTITSVSDEMNGRITCILDSDI